MPRLAAILVVPCALALLACTPETPKVTNRPNNQHRAKATTKIDGSSLDAFRRTVVTLAEQKGIDQDPITAALLAETILTESWSKHDGVSLESFLTEAEHDVLQPIRQELETLLPNAQSIQSIPPLQITPPDKTLILTISNRRTEVSEAQERARRLPKTINWSSSITQQDHYLSLLEELSIALAPFTTVEDAPSITLPLEDLARYQEYTSSARVAKESLGAFLSTISRKTYPKGLIPLDLASAIQQLKQLNGKAPSAFQWEEARLQALEVERSWTTLAAELESQEKDIRVAQATLAGTLQGLLESQEMISGRQLTNATINRINQDALALTSEIDAWRNRTRMSSDSVNLRAIIDNTLVEAQELIDGTPPALASIASIGVMPTAVLPDSSLPNGTVLRLHRYASLTRRANALAAALGDIELLLRTTRLSAEISNLVDSALSLAANPERTSRSEFAQRLKEAEAIVASCESRLTTHQQPNSAASALVQAIDELRAPFESLLNQSDILSDLIKSTCRNITMSPPPNATILFDEVTLLANAHELERKAIETLNEGRGSAPYFGSPLTSECFARSITSPEFRNSFATDQAPTSQPNTLMAALDARFLLRRQIDAVEGGCKAANKAMEELLERTSDTQTIFDTTENTKIASTLGPLHPIRTSRDWDFFAPLLDTFSAAALSKTLDLGRDLENSLNEAKSAIDEHSETLQLAQSALLGATGPLEDCTQFARRQLGQISSTFYSNLAGQSSPTDRELLRVILDSGQQPSTLGTDATRSELALAAMILEIVAIPPLEIMDVQLDLTPELTELGNTQPGCRVKCAPNKARMELLVGAPLDQLLGVAGCDHVSADTNLSEISYKPILEHGDTVRAIPLLTFDVVRSAFNPYEGFDHAWAPFAWSFSAGDNAMRRVGGRLNLFSPKYLLSEAADLAIPLIYVQADSRHLHVLPGAQNITIKWSYFGDSSRLPVEVEELHPQLIAFPFSPR